MTPMEGMKKSTLGKAFSRTFNRKSLQSSLSSPSTLHLQSTKKQGVAEPAKALAPIVTTTTIVDNADADANAIGNGRSTNDGPLSPISLVSLTESNSASLVTSPTRFVYEEEEALPRRSTTHVRDWTAMSNASTVSCLGMSGSEDNNQDASSNPADILLRRLVAYKAVIKNLQQYFAEIALIESGIAKSMNKASNLVVIPFKDGTQFLGRGGLQDVCAGVRDSSKLRSEQHANAARFLEETIVRSLRRLKQDIKNRIKAIKSDANLYSTRLFKERELTQERIGKLAKAIGLFEMAGGLQRDMEKLESDPYVINLSLKRQLARQVQEETLFARALQQCQEQVASFEGHIIKAVKEILAAFSQYQLDHANSGFSQSWASAEIALDVLQEDTEWTYFMERNEHRLLPSELVDSNPDDLDYPHKSNPYVLPIMTAHMSRKSSVLKNWKKGFFVLTQAGWLHVFATDDVCRDPLPDRSIHLLTAVLGPHTEPGQKQHVFSIDGKGMGGLLHRDAQTFTVRANSREEMISWWSEISKLTHSTTYTKLGDGGLDGGALSRTRTRAYSTSSVRLVRGNGAKTPDPYQQGSLPPYASAGKSEYFALDKTEYTAPNKSEYTESSAATSSLPTVVVAARPVRRLRGASSISDIKSRPLRLSRHNTGSTVSLDFSRPSRAGTTKIST
ncbi:hypothetical protein EMPS_00503 [Entomortierella parvispora]|uniref:PH domain-containing protein n=1 Tax=Entomortierella parvispora TaxID=205924 RepID=A0A9P3H182_9FUNG|nr:hypothetical protein EMPS_00503 [Entomortierella parvispora]